MALPPEVKATLRAVKIQLVALIARVAGSQTLQPIATGTALVQRLAERVLKAVHIESQQPSLGRVQPVQSLMVPLIRDSALTFQLALDP